MPENLGAQNLRVICKPGPELERQPRGSNQTDLCSRGYSSFIHIIIHPVLSSFGREDMGSRACVTCPGSQS